MTRECVPLTLPPPPRRPRDRYDRLERTGPHLQAQRVRRLVPQLGTDSTLRQPERVANSLWGLSHDGDKEAFIDINAFNSSRILRIMLFSNGTSTQTALDQVLPQLQAYPDTTTIPGIGRGTNDEYLLPWAVAYSPTDDHAVIAVSVHRTAATFNGSLNPCPWASDSGAPPDKCLLPNTVVNSVAISEDGSQMIINEGMKYEKYDALPSGPEGCSPNRPGDFGYCIEANRTESTVSCMITYRSMATGAILEPKVSARWACDLPAGMTAAVKANGRMKTPSLRRP